MLKKPTAPPKVSLTLTKTLGSVGQNQQTVYLHAKNVKLTLVPYIIALPSFCMLLSRI